MKFSVQRMVVCPMCRASLNLEVFSAEDHEVIDGVLRCSCGLEYPIIQGVPRLLPPDLLSDLPAQYPDFFARSRHRVASPPDPTGRLTAVRRQTQDAFGYEWTWAADYHADNFADWLPVGLHARTLFAERVGLEVGCGAGRHAASTAALAREHFAVDISRAVDVAFSRTRGLDNCHVIQADVLRLPFPEQRFDYVYCLGVLQHVAEPETGFHRLAKHTRPGGALVVNVYQASRPVVLFLLECFRRVTTRLPNELVRHISIAAGVLDYGLFIGPWKRLRSTRFGRAVSPLVPARIQEYAKHDFDTCVTDWFDRLACPVKKHFRRIDVERWYQEAGYSNTIVTPYWKAFWNACGWRAA